MKHRRKGREFALQCLYSMEVGQVKMNDVQQKVVEGLKMDDDSLDYGIQLAEMVLENVLDIDDRIVKSSENWDLERISIIDKILIRCSVAEMIYMEKVPFQVSITEAVQLAKKYSSEESSRFINGVLDSISKENEQIK